MIDDYELVSQDMMDFDQALVVMRENGDRVARAGWDGTRTISINDDELRVHTEDLSTELDELTSEDILASDWVIVVPDSELEAMSA